MLVAGCALDNAGTPAPAGELNFPIAIALAPSVGGAPSPYLFVANSNFDLRYSSATVQSYDLGVIDRALGERCSAAGVDPSECALVPNASDAEQREGLTAIYVPSMLASEVVIGSFADGLEIAPDGRRLYLPVRSDSDVTWIDVDANGQLACGAPATGRPKCDQDHRHVDRTLLDARGLDLPTDPVDIAVGPLTALGTTLPGNYLLIAQRNASVTLAVDMPSMAKPAAVDVMSELGLEQVTATVDPTTGLVWVPTGVAPGVASNLIARAGLAIDGETATPDQMHLWRTTPAVITAVNNGADTREVRFDPRDPSLLYVLSRSPTAVLVARRALDDGRLDVKDVIAVGTGPSRMTLATVPVGGGRPDRLLAFVSCFDERDVYVIDLDRRQVLAVVRNVSGPFELEPDLVRERLYVTDFRTSSIRVFDLGPLLRCLRDEAAPELDRTCAPQILGLIGKPVSVRELQ